MLKMTTTLFCAIIIGSGIAISRGQEVYFQEIDFSTDGGNKAHVKVRHNGQNLVPFTIRVHPVTLNQYFTVFGGVGCTTLGINVNPAEVNDFNTTILERVIPAGSTGYTTYIFEVDLFQDNIVEGNEVFLALLTVAGDPALSVIRNCTAIEVLEPPITGQFLRWKHKGKDVNSFSTVAYLEDRGTQVIITAERLVPAELNVTIHASLQRGSDMDEGTDFILPATTYIITPEQTSVEILLTVIDDNIVEDDESGLITLVASVPFVYLGHETSRAVTVQILDNDALLYGLLNPPVITVTEGETFTVLPGVIGNVTGVRTFEIAKLYTKSGSAIEGKDFTKLEDLILMGRSEQPKTVMTIARNGIQLTRSFTVLLRPDPRFPVHNKTIIYGALTINILDTSMIPLAPSISNLTLVNTMDEQLNVTWSWKTTDRRPLDTILIIIKSCPTESCEINPDSLQPDEKQIMIGQSDVFELLLNVDGKNAAYAIVVCAINILGKNCSSSKGIIMPQNPTENKEVIITRKLDDEGMLVTTEATPIKLKFKGIVIMCLFLLLLCCTVPLIVLIICFWYKKNDRERSYFPRKEMGRELKGYSPDSSDIISVEFDTDEIKHSEMKYI